MNSIELRKDELILIQKIRQAPKHTTFSVEKRPSNEFPNGEIYRITVETSHLVRELAPKME